jgi:hypothetical protein
MSKKELVKKIESLLERFENTDELGLVFEAVDLLEEVLKILK